ncbi:hypothetical protein OGAPHI_005280 [Ogataea philodendri]|uniref:Uncharacterized protein n=1 Tax=Ogataea philodendri TaxID=1378263 RepID=A0A9P8P2A9_9ASCO|nr:uncharacterized protein OGAPHI_005280 [Ogataea philodendri]KAH3663877.1 hypothetical protein OGAPHI_005280 [Ogataea philodendri]
MSTFGTLLMRSGCCNPISLSIPPNRDISCFSLVTNLPNNPLCSSIWSTISSVNRTWASTSMVFGSPMIPVSEAFLKISTSSGRSPCNSHSPNSSNLSLAEELNVSPSSSRARALTASSDMSTAQSSSLTTTLREGGASPAKSPAPDSLSCCFSAISAILVPPPPTLAEAVPLFLLFFGGGFFKMYVTSFCRGSQDVIFPHALQSLITLSSLVMVSSVSGFLHDGHSTNLLMKLSSTSCSFPASC